MTSSTSFQALVARQGTGNSIDVKLETLTLDDLPPGDVLVRVLWSSLNFKDAAALANRGILRQLPIVPGIDLAGVVEQSADARYRPGDEVVLTGWLVGEQYWGGLSQYARVDGDWLVRKPDRLSLRDCMAVGTAGLAAMLGVLALEQQGLRPDQQEVLVTGAAGGVGSMAVTLFARKGYRVAALTGRPDTAAYLQELGAQRIVPRDAFASVRRPGRAGLEAETYSAALDVVGGAVLSSIFPQIAYGGSIAVCGLAGGIDVDTTVFPFLLRAIRVIGIDSVRAPASDRGAAWQAIAGLLDTADVHRIGTDIGLDQVLAESQRLLAGAIRGRCVVRLW